MRAESAARWPGPFWAVGEASGDADGAAPCWPTEAVAGVSLVAAAAAGDAAGGWDLGPLNNADHVLMPRLTASRYPRLRGLQWQGGWARAHFLLARARTQGACRSPSRQHALRDHADSWPRCAWQGSTRSRVHGRGAAEYSFEEALLQGIAEDGGLFVPKRLPTFGSDVLRKW
jgi:hypothetical protein